MNFFLLPKYKHFTSLKNTIQNGRDNRAILILNHASNSQRVWVGNFFKWSIVQRDGTET